MRFTVAVLLSAIAATEAESLATSLKKCAAVPDSLQRLVCYDDLAKGNAGTPLDASARTPMTLVSSPSPAPTSSRTSQRQTTSVRCQATTQKGRQCKRTASSGSSYCWQHGR